MFFLNFVGKLLFKLRDVQLTLLERTLGLFQLIAQACVLFDAVSACFLLLLQLLHYLLACCQLLAQLLVVVLQFLLQFGQSHLVAQ